MGLIKDFLNNAVHNLSAPKMTYSVPSGAIREIFTPEPLLFRNQPELHYALLVYLDMQDRAKSSEYREKYPNIAKSFYANPGQTIARAELGYRSDESRIPASPAVMYTEFHISAQRTGFAVMLRDHLMSGEEHKQDRHGCIKFAMGGYFDERGQFTVERLKLPETFINPHSKRKELKATEIHENSVNGALYYARLCTEQLFARKTFTPEYNFEQSVTHIPDNAQLKVMAAPYKM